MSKNTFSEKAAAGFIALAVFIGCLSGFIFVGYIISVALGGVEQGGELPPGWKALVPFIPWTGMAVGVAGGAVTAYRYLRSARLRRQAVSS